MCVLVYNIYTIYNVGNCTKHCEIISDIPNKRYLIETHGSMPAENVPLLQKRE